VRLDWLDNCYDWQLSPTPTVFVCAEHETTIRLAIDSAIAQQDKPC